MSNESYDDKPVLISNYGFSPIEYTTGGGYICWNCKKWITSGVYHSCYELSTYVFIPTTYTTIDSQRLAELMKAERKLKEIERILAKADG